MQGIQQPDSIFQVFTTDCEIKMLIFCCYESFVSTYFFVRFIQCVTFRAGSFLFFPGVKWIIWVSAQLAAEKCLITNRFFVHFWHCPLADLYQTDKKFVQSINRKRKSHSIHLLCRSLIKSFNKCEPWTWFLYCWCMSWWKGSVVMLLYIDILLPAYRYMVSSSTNFYLLFEFAILLNAFK